MARMMDIKAGAIDEDGLGINNVDIALKRVGLTIRDETGGFREMGTVLEEVASKWETLGELEQANIAKAIAAPLAPFRCIGVAVDFTDSDSIAMQYAIQLGADNARFVLIHVVESASAQLIGNEAHDYETRKDKLHLDEYVAMF
jgi:hypothetical protein